MSEETNLAADLADGYLLLILPKFPASLSILGSLMIISSVVRSKQNRENVQQRLVAAMSAFDCMVSSVWLLTNFFIPPGYGSMMPATFGNTASCNAQGFLVQLSIASVIYNASLSFYYLLVIKYNWRNTRIAQIEKYLHIVPIAFGVFTAIIAVSMKTIGNADWDCWIAPDEENSNEKLVNSFRLGFLCTWIFPTIARIVQLAHGTVPKWLVVVCGTFIPLGGFVNSLVYFRLRFHKCGAEHSDKGSLWVIGRIILLTLMPCFTKDIHNTNDGRDLEDDLQSCKTLKSAASRLSSMDHTPNVADAVSAEVTPQPKTLSKWEKMNAAKSTTPNRLSLRGLRVSWKTLRQRGTQTIGKAKSTRTLAAMFDKLSKRNLNVEKEDNVEAKEEHFPIPCNENEEIGDVEFLPNEHENENKIVAPANDTLGPKDASSKQEIQVLLTSAAKPNTVQVNELNVVESIDSETSIRIEESTENCFLSSNDEELVTPEVDIEQPESSFHCSHTSPYSAVLPLDTCNERSNGIDGTMALNANNKNDKDVENVEKSSDENL